MSQVQLKPTHPRLLKRERTDSGCILHWHIPEDLYYFDGHFPQLPIVAGVCQLKWVIDAIQTYTGETLQLSALEDVKFLRPLSPGQSCVLELTYAPHPPSWRYEIYTEDTKRAASGRLLVRLA
jgi:3-hydroxymyristoyl/3-hydroxydecanoyl-(acyl carrier protein) dehydratase